MQNFTKKMLAKNDLGGVDAKLSVFPALEQNG